MCPKPHATQEPPTRTADLLEFPAARFARLCNDELVCLCFQPAQPQWITPGLETHVNQFSGEKKSQENGPVDRKTGQNTAMGVGQ